MTEIVLADHNRAVHPDDRPVVLPFYLLCDVSYSMEPDIAALNSALFRIRDALVMEPVLSDKVRFGVIDFSDDARVVVPLSDFAEVNLPTVPLQVRGGTSYGEAFRVLKQTIDADIAGADSRFRFFRPAVFFLTDGYPTDPGVWEQAFTELTAFDPATGHGNQRYPLFVPFGFGQADPAVLSRLVHPQNRSTMFLAGAGVSPEAAIERMTRGMLTSMLQSGRSATRAKPTHVLPTAADLGPGIDVYPGGDYLT
ncbi:VWA domain-containing protein [Geodermatophilus sp. SYSU D01180]